MLKALFQTTCIALLLCGTAAPATAQVDAPAKKSAKATEGPRKYTREPKATSKATPGARVAKPPLRRRTAPSTELKPTLIAQPVAPPAASNARWNSRSKDWGKPSNNQSFKRAPGCLVPYRIVSQCLTNLPPMQAAEWW
jgi:hypothetical protein